MRDKDVEKQIEANKRSIERADKFMKERDETLREAKERGDRARAILRRAGYLR